MVDPLNLHRGLDYVVTAGERPLILPALSHLPVMDIGLRFISLSTVFQLFAHFGLEIRPPDLARHYMRTMMGISEKWPALDQDRFRHLSRLGRVGTTLSDKGQDFLKFLTGPGAGTPLKDQP